MGGCVTGFHGEWLVALTSSVNQQIAVTDAGDEFESRIRNLGVCKLEEFRRFFRGNVIGGEVVHDLVLNGDQITPNRPIVGSKLNPLRRGLKRRTTGKKFVGVVSKKAHVCDVGPGRQMCRNMIGFAHVACRRDFIHGWNIGCLKRRFPAQTFQGFICTSIRDDYHVFHGR